jgi:alpha-methylacyl-CoA racemase
MGAGDRRDGVEAAVTADGDLAGLVVIDLGGMGPAARCVRLLADLGARWIRIAAPGSAGRHDMPWHVYGAMRGAEEIALDLKAPAGREVLLRLAERADVVVECFRPGVADRLGIGYRAVQARNPRIVYCAATGFGQSGPYAALAAHDLNYQALSGALDGTQRRADGAPAVPAITAADSAGGGWLAALRILAALQARSRTGQGQFLDIAAAEGMLHLNALALDEALAGGAPGDLLTGFYACYEIYPAADGGHLAVAAIEPRFFATLCACLGLPALAAAQYDRARQDEVKAALRVAFATRSRDAWMQALAGKDVCVSPVLSLAEVAQDPHWQAAGMFRRYRHPLHGDVVQLAAVGGGERGPVPARDGASQEALLRSFGFTDAEIAALRPGAGPP